MKKPAFPDVEAKRQRSVDALQVLDTPAEERFDRITRLARRVFGVPIVLVSLVDRDRQWFKSAQGLDVTETPRDVSFCGHAILDGGALVVNDANADERFADNPLVTGEPRIRFYAGHPIRAGDGYRVGTLCLIDTEPRQLSPDERETLADLAALVENELRTTELSEAQLALRAELASAQMKAAIDPLTRLWNRASISEIARRERSRARRTGGPFALALLDIDDFKKVNDVQGHLAGDRVLRVAAERMRAAVRPYDAVGRYGGEEFLIVLAETDADTAKAVCERVRGRVETGAVAGVPRVTASIGLAHGAGDALADFERVVAIADEALYRAKRSGKNKVVAVAA
jgi:diguanylate cyclase (GGDEF)-like protein